MFFLLETRPYLYKELRGGVLKVPKIFKFEPWVGIEVSQWCRGELLGQGTVSLGSSKFHLVGSKGSLFPPTTVSHGPSLAGTKDEDFWILVPAA
jgi:hypothetical protein